MKLISWNVNGIRAAMKGGFWNLFKEEKPDILLLQEIKIADRAREKEAFNFGAYEGYWNPAARPGYSGTAVLVKNGIRVLNYYIGFEKFSARGGSAFGGDREGRVQTLEFEKFYLINVYFPHSNRDLSRLPFKLKFNQAFLRYLLKLSKEGKPLIIGGDYNVAHQEIDIKNAKSNTKNAGFTIEERRWMTKYLENGLVDTFRYLNPDKIQYSWWTYMFKARERNIGWRIDYFLVSVKIAKKLKKAFILDKITGSDHAPVGVELDI